MKDASLPILLIVIGAAWLFNSLDWMPVWSLPSIQMIPPISAAI